MTDQQDDHTPAAPTRPAVRLWLNSSSNNGADWEDLGQHGQEQQQPSPPDDGPESDVDDESASSDDQTFEYREIAANWNERFGNGARPYPPISEVWAALGRDARAGDTARTRPDGFLRGFYQGSWARPDADPVSPRSSRRTPPHPEDPLAAAPSTASDLQQQLQATEGVLLLVVICPLLIATLCMYGVLALVLNVILSAVVFLTANLNSMFWQQQAERPRQHLDH